MELHTQQLPSQPRLQPLQAGLWVGYTTTGVEAGEGVQSAGCLAQLSQARGWVTSPGSQGHWSQTGFSLGSYMESGQG